MFHKNIRQCSHYLPHRKEVDERRNQQKQKVTTRKTVKNKTTVKECQKKVKEKENSYEHID